MNRALKRVSVATLVLAVGGAGMMIGRVARSEEEALLADIKTTELTHVYRPGSHFTIAIQLPDSAAPYKFTKNTKVAPAAFTDTTGAHKAKWEVHSHGPDSSGQKMLITFIAKQPDCAVPECVANGTGTILVTTSEPCCPANATTMTLDVTPMDGADVP